jgi:hypothetical protein
LVVDVSQPFEQNILQVLHRSVAPRLRNHDAGIFLDEHLRTANFALPADANRFAGIDRFYHTNEEFWGDILETRPDRRLRPNTTIRLDGFRLTEWVPRSPGVFHTDLGRDARVEAYRWIRPDSNRIGSRAPLDQRANNTNNDLNHLPVIFDPNGKLSMIEGGVGCIRTKSWRVKSDEPSQEWWLVGATSSAVAHEGLPVRLSDDLYRSFIDDIEGGGVIAALIGKVRFIPDELVALYGYGRGIPKIYVEVEEVLPRAERRGRRDRCLVSAAVSFQSDYEGVPSLYATYVTFDTGEPRSLQRAVEWLDKTYVSQLYGGRIVTDFDQQSTHFAGATFSLDCLLRAKLDAANVRNTIDVLSLGANADRIIAALQQVRTIHIEKVGQMTKTQTINFGNNATVSAPVTIADTIQGSFNTIQASQADPDVKDLLEALVTAVSQAACSSNVSEGQARSLARDSKDLAKEATDPEPRIDVCRSFLSRIEETAKAIGEVGVPVIKIVAELSSLFGG